MLKRNRHVFAIAFILGYIGWSTMNWIIGLSFVFISFAILWEFE